MASDKKKKRPKKITFLYKICAEKKVFLTLLVTGRAIKQDRHRFKLKS